MTRSEHAHGTATQEVVEGFRLSPQQRRLWALQRADGGAPYRAWLALRIDGELEDGPLRSAIDDVAESWEILRTCFRTLPGAKLPLQVIAAPAVAWNPPEDWTDTAPASWPERLQAAAGQALEPAVDLARGPLWTVTRVVLGPARSLLLLRMPALLADGEGLVQLAARLVGGYAARVAGEAANASQDMQYADLSEWLNQLLDAEDAAEGREFWRARLPDDFGSHRLPFEKRSPGGGSYDPAILDRPVEPSLAAELEALARRWDVGLGNLLLACWQTYLWRLTERAEIVVGTLFEGRDYEELEQALGLFGCYLPMRCRPKPTLGVGELAAEAAGAREEASEWQELFSWDGLARTADETPPALPFGFAFFEAAADWQAGGIKVTIEDRQSAIDHFKVELVGERRDDGLRVRFRYDRRWLRHADVEHLAEQFHQLLHSVATSPSASIAQLPVTSDLDLRLARSFNRVAPAKPADPMTVDERCDRQAARDPDRVALVFEDQRLSYGELRARSDRLAHRLGELGVAAEVPVGICLERSPEVVVAMLAVLKAGGAYVPLDPSFPDVRLVEMLSDAGARVLVTEARRAERFTDPELRLVFPDAEDDEPACSPQAAPTGLRSAARLAYAIFTSGSTGRAKGVAIEHRELASYLDGVSRRLRLPAGGSYALVSTFAADLGNTVIYPALTTGGTLHIVAEDRLAAPDRFASYFARHAIDCLKIVPSHFSVLLAAQRPARVMPRQRLILGGEASAWPLVRQAAELVPECRVFNHYGPTETTVGVIAGELDAAATSFSPPLGRPLANTRVHLLDRDLQPVPSSFAGELFIAGAGVSRGYLGQPALSAERFIPDPLAPEPGGRLYRTGDLARLLPGGELEFMGRADRQIKIRGFRVEPGEVEAALGDHPEVREAVVVLREDEETGHRRLVAYTVAAETPGPSPGALRRWLAERVPGHMVPSAFVGLEWLPLTPNGKLDLRALPAPQAHRVADGQARGPRNEIEVQLIHLWEELLEVSPIGVTEDFFELGGDSFLAVRLMTQIHKHLGLLLPLATLIEATTIEQIAALLEPEPGGQAPSHLVAIQPRGTKTPLYCAPPGHGSILCYLELAHHLGPEQPFYGLQALALEGTDAPFLSIEQLADRYVEEIRRGGRGAPYIVAGWSFGGLVAFEMAQQLVAMGQEVARLILLDSRLPVTGSVLTGIAPARLKSAFLLDHARNVASVSGGELPISVDDLEELEVEQQLDLLAESFDLEDLLPPDVDASQVRRYLEVRMARIEAVRRYEPRPYSGRVTLFRTEEVNLQAPLKEMQEAFEKAAREPTYGWSELARQPVEVRTVPGNHETMIRGAHVRVLTEQLREVLDESGGRHEG